MSPSTITATMAFLPFGLRKNSSSSRLSMNPHSTKAAGHFVLFKI